VPWLEHPNYAMGSIILMALWKSAAFFSVILLAALQDVPKSLHEAARVDGAGTLARFRHVTLPCIMPVMGSVAILSGIGAFRVFVPMYVLTQGGPAHSTRTLALHAYEAAFTNGQVGYSAAISFVLMGIIIAVSLTARALRRG
jgi:multiple sugar transport system permease protein